VNLAITDQTVVVTQITVTQIIPDTAGLYCNKQPELILNGGFDDASHWTCDAVWTIAEGVATHTGDWGFIHESGICVIGRTYRIKFDQNMSSVFITNGATQLILVQGLGHKDFTFVADGNWLGFATSDDGSIDNVSVERGDAGLEPIISIATILIPSLGTLSLTGVQPLAVQGIFITPAQAALAIANLQPSQEVSIVPTQAVLTLSGQDGRVVEGFIVIPSTGSLIITGTGEQEVEGIFIVPGLGVLAITGLSANTEIVLGATQIDIIPSLGTISIDGKKVNVDVITTIPIYHSLIGEPFLEEELRREALQKQLKREDEEILAIALKFLELVE
jgi:hypothetical protein